MRKEEILNQLKQIDKEEFGIEKIGLFGSYARGCETENSDIDILVKLKKDRMYKNFCNTKYYLEDLFNKEIDLITINQFEEEYKTKLAKDNREKIKKEIMESVIYA